MPLPTNRTTANTAAEHVSDHNLLHAFYNAYEGTAPANFAAASHVHAASAITSGTLATARLGSGTGTSANFLRGDGAWQPVTVSAVTSPIGVPLSSFSGADDDARLVAYNTARTTAGSGLFGYPVVLDQSRVYTFNTSLAVTSGFCMIGGVRPVDQARSQKPIGTQVNLRLGALGGWLTVPNGLSFGISLIGISFDANANSRVFQPNASANLTACTLRDISYQNGPGVIGSSAQHMPITISTIEGFGNWNNIRDRAFNLGGSDSTVDFSRCNLDSNSTFMTDDQYIVECTALSKTYVKGMYITADRHSAMLVDQSNNDLTFDHCVFEGRNSTTPCFGALVRNSSSYTTFINCWFGYAMTAPGSGPNGGDLGYVHCTNGTHTFIGCHTRLANANTPSSTSTIYATGSNTHVIVQAMVGEGNTSVTGGGQTDGVRFTPRVRVVGGATSQVDGSVTLVTS